LNKFLFLHIPKTAGLSLFKIFENILGYQNVFHINNPKGKAARQQPHELNKYTLLAGHLTLEEYKKHFPDRRCLLFLRNPVDRFISHFFFAKYNMQDTSLPFVKAAQSMDLEKYIKLYQNQNKMSIWNLQTLHMGFHEITLPRSELVKLARERLAEVDFVGIYESLSESLDFLCDHFHWPPVKEIPNINTTLIRPQLPQLDASITAKLTELCSLDMELYQYGLSLFDQRRKVK